MLGSGGFRLYAHEAEGRWTKVAKDSDYGDASFGVAFAADGRLATTSRDGRLRLYGMDGKLLRCVETEAGPAALAFNPLDGRLVTGSGLSPSVSLYDGTTLASWPPPNLDGLGNGTLASVCWSHDGATLFAAGEYDDGGGSPIVTWRGGGTGPRHLLRAGNNTVMCLRALPGGGLLGAAQDPWVGALADDGTPRWSQGPHLIDLSGQQQNLGAASDGMLIEFGLKAWGKERLRFDVATLKMLPPTVDSGVAPPIQDSLAIADWINSGAPTLHSALLPLEPFEFARSLAIHPDGDRFLLGTEWWLRAFDMGGAELWRRAVPGIAWAVNISGDGRLAVAAYDDGTLRWHRIEDGVELLALLPMPDGENWVAWTPEGVYAATPDARNVLRWHVNHGWDAAGDAIPVSAIPETFRPEVIPHVLPQLGTAGAIAVAELAKIRAAVQRATGSDVPPGARLHVLTIGVSDPGDAARSLELAHAHRDALDVAAALRNARSNVYAKVFVSELLDADATKSAIYGELAAIGRAMQDGDVALILFSGHGHLVDGKLYLLQHGVDARSTPALKASALLASDFRDEIAAFAQRGRALLFIDACRSGGATAPLGQSLQALLNAPNLTVFTSSSAGEYSWEDDAWQNGAFTEALLEALRLADADRDGLVRISDLSRHLSDRVRELTGDKQHPEVEVRFEARILPVLG